MARANTGHLKGLVIKLYFTQQVCRKYKYNFIQGFHLIVLKVMNTEMACQRRLQECGLNFVIKVSSFGIHAPLTPFSVIYSPLCFGCCPPLSY